LEEALLKRKNSYQFNTPAVPIIGFGTQSRPKPSDNEVEINADQDQHNDGNESYASDRLSDVVEMIEELEDSTEISFVERDDI
jgi:hypothetical protein